MKKIKIFYKETLETGGGNIKGITDNLSEYCQEKKEKIDFLDFQKIKGIKGIDKDFYKNQIKEFKEKNPSGYEILQNMDGFLLKNNLNETKSILAIILFVKQIQEKKEIKHQLL